MELDSCALISVGPHAAGDPTGVGPGNRFQRLDLLPPRRFCAVCAAHQMLRLRLRTVFVACFWAISEFLGGGLMVSSPWDWFSQTMANRDGDRQ
jgi:hypothetical protein